MRLSVRPAVCLSVCVSVCVVLVCLTATSAAQELRWLRNGAKSRREETLYDGSGALPRRSLISSLLVRGAADMCVSLPPRHVVSVVFTCAVNTKNKNKKKSGETRRRRVALNIYVASRPVAGIRPRENETSCWVELEEVTVQMEGLLMGP